MAKITSKTTKPIETETVAEETVETPNNALESIQKRLEAIEAENQALKDAKNPMKKARKINDDPKKFRYQEWGGVPVLSYVSYKKDDSKDWLYKWPWGGMIPNQFLKLELANGKVAKVEANEYNASCTKSELTVPIGIITKPDNSRIFKFHTEEFGEIDVLEQVIN